MVELGRVDIYHEVSVLSQYLALPRAGHLEAVYHIFAYLNKHDKSSIVFDQSPVEGGIALSRLPAPSLPVFVGWPDLHC
jgi:hypothetical protein